MAHKLLQGNTGQYNDRNNRYLLHALHGSWKADYYKCGPVKVPLSVLGLLTNCEYPWLEINPCMLGSENRSTLK